MKRVILDTNIYEFMLREFDADAMYRIGLQKEFIIYGNEIIRKELRDVPREKTGIINKKLIKLRNALLGVYDILTKKHSLTTTPVIRLIAEKYYIAYRAAGGNISKDSIINDFIIVASASFNGLDLVVSEDSRSMMSDAAKNGYEIVNNLENLRTPNFIRFENFLKEIRRYVS